MENIVILFLVISIILVLRSKFSSSYLASDNSGSNFATYVNLAYDISTINSVNQTWSGNNQSPSTIYWELAQSSDFTVSRETINYNIWNNNSVTVNSGTSYAASSIWGFRKQLQIGGGGPVWYLINIPTGDQNSITSIPPGSDLVATQSITTYTDPTTSAIYAIPNYVICKKSQVSAVLSCDTNATLTTAQNSDGSGGTCTCKAGYYGNGATCAICPTNTYCTGNGTASPCTASQITVGQGSISSGACFAPCPANSTPIGGTTSTSATCTCNAGFYGTGSCTQCPSGSFCTGGNTVVACPANQTSPAQSTTSSSCTCNSGYYFSSSICTNCPAMTAKSGAGNSQSLCISCPNGSTSDPTNTSCILSATPGAITSYLSSSCSVGTYSPTGYSVGGATCTSCSAGYYQPNTGQTNCIQCNAGYYQPNTGQTSCNPCPSGLNSGAGSSICNIFYQLTWTSSGSGNGAPTSGQVSCTGTSPPAVVLNNGIIKWITPISRSYTFNLTGGGGGKGNYAGSNAQNIVISIYIAVNTPVYMVIGQGGVSGTPSQGGGGGGGTFVFVTNGNSGNQDPPLNINSSVIAVIGAAGGRGGWMTGTSLNSGTLVTNFTFSNGTSSLNYSRQTPGTLCQANYWGNGAGIYGLNCGSTPFNASSFLGGYASLDYPAAGGFGGGSSISDNGPGGAGGLTGQSDVSWLVSNNSSNEVYALSGYGFPMSGVPSSGTTGYPGAASVSFVTSGPGVGASGSMTSGNNGRIIIS